VVWVLATLLGLVCKYAHRWHTSRTSSSGLQGCAVHVGSMLAPAHCLRCGCPAVGVIMRTGLCRGQAVCHTPMRAAGGTGMAEFMAKGTPQRRLL
jgi:hypothetical protein